MLMNTTFLGDSFSIKWQSRGIAYLLCECNSDQKIIGEKFRKGKQEEN